MNNAPSSIKLDIYRQENLIPEESFSIPISNPNWGVRLSPDAINGERVANLSELDNGNNAVTVYAR